VGGGLFEGFCWGGVVWGCLLCGGEEGTIGGLIAPGAAQNDPEARLEEYDDFKETRQKKTAGLRRRRSLGVIQIKGC